MACDDSTGKQLEVPMAARRRCPFLCPGLIRSEVLIERVRTAEKQTMPESAMGSDLSRSDAPTGSTFRDRTIRQQNGAESVGRCFAPISGRVSSPAFIHRTTSKQSGCESLTSHLAPAPVPDRHVWGCGCSSFERPRNKPRSNRSCALRRRVWRAPFSKRHPHAISPS